MLRIYEEQEFLYLNQAVQYFNLLSGLRVEVEMLVQLINEKKLACYVNTKQVHGYLVKPFTEKKVDVIGVGMSKIVAPVIRFNIRTKRYEACTATDGGLRLNGELLRQNVGEFWSLQLKRKSWCSYRLQGEHYYYEIFVKLADVKAYLKTKLFLKNPETKSEATSNSALLTVAGLLKLLSDPEFLERYTHRKVTQDLIAGVLEEQVGVSKSTSTKLFAEARKKLKELEK